MPDTLVRRAGAADLADLVPLFDAYRVFYGRPADPDGARAFLQERLERGESVVLLAAGAEPLGFAQLYPSFSSVALRRIWILNDLFVAREARGRGVGRALLSAAQRHARETGAARLTLQTEASNRAAQALYEATGWQRDERFLSYNLHIDRP